MNRTYDSELFSFNARLNENIDEEYLKRALIDPSYNEIQKRELEELGTLIINYYFKNYDFNFNLRTFPYFCSKRNEKLVDERRLICEYYRLPL